MTQTELAFFYSLFITLTIAFISTHYIRHKTIKYIIDNGLHDAKEFSSFFNLKRMNTSRFPFYAMIMIVTGFVLLMSHIFKLDDAIFISILLLTIGFSLLLYYKSESKKH